MSWGLLLYGGRDPPPYIIWCLVRATYNMHIYIYKLIKKEKAGASPRKPANPHKRRNGRQQLLTNPSTVFCFCPPRIVCNAFAIRVFSFIRHLGNIPCGKLTSPLRGARSHLQHHVPPPLTSALRMLRTPPLWHWGHVLCFFGCFLIL